MPQGICAVSSFGGGVSFGGMTWFTWDGEANVAPPVAGFASYAGSAIGIDLAPIAGGVGMVSTHFTNGTYNVELLDASTGELLQSNTYPVPEGCTGPGHAMFRPTPDGSLPTEVLITCNTSGNVVSGPITGES